MDAENLNLQETVTVSEKRVRTLTDKALELYNLKKEAFARQLEETWELVQIDLEKYESCIKETVVLTNFERSIVWFFDKFLDVSINYSNFLSSAYTQDSINELDNHKTVVQNYKLKVDCVLKDIQLEKQKCVGVPKMSLDGRSVHSGSGRGSIRSQSSSVVARTLAKAEAARVRLKYAEKEAELRKIQSELKEKDQIQAAFTARKNADLQADLELLKQKGDAEAVEAEAQTLRSIEESNLPNVFDSLPSHVVKKEHFVSHVSNDPSKHVDSRDYVNKMHSVLNPTAPDFQPTFTSTTPVSHPVHTDKTEHKRTADTGIEHSAMSDLSSFLLKKELLLSRLTKFNERPEQYAMWKASFKSIMIDLKVTSLEELDLLVKWLGPEASRQALSIRASNVNDPSRGLSLIWERLDDRYGCPELIEASLKTKLANFPKLGNKDYKKLYDLTDILSEIECTKADVRYASLLSYFDSSSGVSPIVSKLPYGIQEKWTTEASKYKLTYSVSFPPFSYFVNFIRRMSKVKNDPSFVYECFQTTGDKRDKRVTSNVLSRKTDVGFTTQNASEDIMKRCPIHKADHTLNECRTFKAKSYAERKKYLKSQHICFRCCCSNKHSYRDCKVDIKCKYCDSSQHASAMHVITPSTPDGGENTTASDRSVTSNCTTLCGKEFSGRSCGKILLVDIYPDGKPEKAVTVYAILDDQSNGSLASKELFDRLDKFSEPAPYNLTSCSGTVTMYGRKVNNITIRSHNDSNSYEINIPSIIECSNIPNNMSEIPTSEVAECYPHLRSIASEIPALDTRFNIQLLIGRDVPDLHHIEQQIIGPKGSPFAQKLPLGWVIIGQVCLNGFHQPETVFVNKTNITTKGRGTIFELCENTLCVKEHPTTAEPPNTRNSIFLKTPDDETICLSIEDRKFLKLMHSEFHIGQDGLWTAPLPFKEDKPDLPNNRPQAWKRALILDASLHKDPVKKEHFITFMGKILDSGAAEVAPKAIKDECWYLPLFGVYHPKKPDQIRGVFDSSAVFEGISLNSVLMSGPDLNNSLLGLLLRFRKDAYAITADIEQMFYRFYVHEDYRDYLRFFWYRDNDIDNPLIEYRMKVHVFGNSPSPAVATYGLRKAVADADADVKSFVNTDFYVDDGLASFPTKIQAIDLMSRTRAVLKSNGNINLHKITSNSTEVMNAFPTEDLGKNLKDLNLGDDPLPLQHSLGMAWDLNDDTFAFTVLEGAKPFTRRGLLATVNSLYDPLGFIAPITISGKIILREITPSGIDWDTPLSDEHHNKWESWLLSLHSLQDVRIPRMIVPTSLSVSKDSQVHLFCDASESAIAAVAYISVVNDDGSSDIGYLMGKSKLAPLKGHTIPRLELCGAVLATEVGEILSRHLNLDPRDFQYHTDSKVVLGYISNQTRRFHTYVSNRVERIHRVSSPKQWHFVSTNHNPADFGTRCSVTIADWSNNPWIVGPRWLCDTSDNNESKCDTFPLINPDNDKELKPEVTIAKTYVEPLPILGKDSFEKFSSWRSVVEKIAVLKRFVRLMKNRDSSNSNWNLKSVSDYKESEILLMKNVQRECFSEELNCLTNNRVIPKYSSIISLSPVLGTDGLVRVGGRLRHCQGTLTPVEINPIIIPKDHPIVTLLIRHYHETVRHQGRHLTEGALRSAGLWIVGAKKSVSSFIRNCVICRKLRRETEHQRMADLPPDRITPGPPFTSVGVDTFGPWQIVTRKTRGGSAESKRWAIMFTCLTTRAVHIEVIEEMSSSSFINALRRFMSVRGPVKLFRSDRGTNFVGSLAEMKYNAVSVGDGSVSTFLHESGSTWILNAPHSSHMGGVWERMIGVARRILDAILLSTKVKTLTHETLTTFMAEVCAIMNARPIAEISSDPESPLILSPSILLTGKVDYLPVVSHSLDIRDIYRAQWKHVQVLADLFWSYWKKDYLQGLQSRRKWKNNQRNVKIGDIVLLKDKNAHRNDWPTGIVESVLLSDDGLVRKANIRVIKDGKPVTYLRPINEMVLLLE